MIRMAAIGSLSALLLLVLYLPSAHPPMRFIEQLRLEHHEANSLWGFATAQRILDRAMTLNAQAAGASPIPTLEAAHAVRGGVGAARQEMDRVNQRLFDNPYFRSIDALLVLAAYRLSAIREWLPNGFFLALVLVIDAVMERLVKAKEFRQHDPEMFALYLSAAIVAACGLMLSLVVPWTMHPLAWAAAPLGIAFLVSRAIADFHRRP